MEIRRYIELFHLLFIKNFLTSQDKSLIILKGGCNLRFFLGSNRYSEDIDFDVTTIARETLKKRVDKVINSQLLSNALAAHKVSIVTHSAPKQTDMVQRWKITINAHRQDIPTKIEFSRRGIDYSGVNFEGVDPQIMVLHRLAPVFLSHYTADQATKQKIEALAGRHETQARDVFDLDLLFSRNPTLKLDLEPELIEQAINCALSVNFDQFRGQVVEFLTPDAQEFYGNIKAWDELQHKVVDRLEGLNS